MAASLNSETKARCADDYFIQHFGSHWPAYLELCKPKVVALMLVTSLIGMLLASDQLVPVSLMIIGNLGIALCAGSAAVVNHVVDRSIDTKMARTFNRPVATGVIPPKFALLFAAILGALGMFVLIRWVNSLTAWLTLASLLGYAVIYTLFLKRATPQNIVIGGLAGAAPPLLGWVAVTGEVDAHAVIAGVNYFCVDTATLLGRLRCIEKKNTPMQKYRCFR